MENSDREKEITRNQWKQVPPKHFLHTLGVGQYVFSKRSSPEVAVAKADEKFYEMTTELNRMIDKLLHQPGGGDHPALDWIWERLDKKLIKKFDLYMKVVDKRQLLNFPRNASILDVTPAFGLIYKKIVEVPVPDGVFGDSVLQVVRGTTDEFRANVAMGEQRDSQLVPEGKVDQQLEQEGEVIPQPAQEMNVGPGLEQEGEADPQPEPEVNLGSGLELQGEADPQPEPEVNLDSGLEQDGEPDLQLELDLNDFPPLVPGQVGAGGIYVPVSWPSSNGMQAMQIKEKTQVRTPTAPQILGLVKCNIKMPRLEDMIEPADMAVYWQKYNEYTKLTPAIGNPKPLKPILKSKSSQSQKKNVRFQVNVEKETPGCQDNIQSMKKRRQKKKYKLILGRVLTRSAQKKREEKKKLHFNGILLQPDLLDQVRFLRSRLV